MKATVRSPMHETLHCQLGLPLRPCGSEIVSLTHSLTPPPRLSLPQLPLFLVSASHLVYAPEVPPRGERAPRPCLPDRQSLAWVSVWEPTSPLHPASALKACLPTHTPSPGAGECVLKVSHTRSCSRCRPQSRTSRGSGSQSPAGALPATLATRPKPWRVLPAMEGVPWKE